MDSLVMDSRQLALSGQPQQHSNPNSPTGKESLNMTSSLIFNSSETTNNRASTQSAVSSDSGHSSPDRDVVIVGQRASGVKDLVVETSSSSNCGQILGGLMPALHSMYSLSNDHSSSTCDLKTKDDPSSSAPNNNGSSLSTKNLSTTTSNDASSFLTCPETSSLMMQSTCPTLSYTFSTDSSSLSSSSLNRMQSNNNSESAQQQGYTSLQTSQSKSGLGTSSCNSTSGLVLGWPTNLSRSFQSMNGMNNGSSVNNQSNNVSSFNSMSGQYSANSSLWEDYHPLTSSTTRDMNTTSLWSSSGKTASNSSASSSATDSSPLLDNNSSSNSLWGSPFPLPSRSCYSSLSPNSSFQANLEASSLNQMSKSSASCHSSLDQMQANLAAATHLHSSSNSWSDHSSSHGHAMTHNNDYNGINKNNGLSNGFGGSYRSITNSRTNGWNAQPASLGQSYQSYNGLGSSSNYFRKGMPFNGTSNSHSNFNNSSHQNQQQNMHHPNVITTHNHSLNHSQTSSSQLHHRNQSPLMMMQPHHQLQAQSSSNQTMLNTNTNGINTFCDNNVLLSSRSTAQQHSFSNNHYNNKTIISTSASLLTSSPVNCSSPTSSMSPVLTALGSNGDFAVRVQNILSFKAVFVDNVSPLCKPEDLYSLFSVYGRVTGVEVKPVLGNVPTFACLEFADSESPENAVTDAMNNPIMKEGVNFDLKSPISVKFTPDRLQRRALSTGCQARNWAQDVIEKSGECFEWRFNSSCSLGKNCYRKHVVKHRQIDTLKSFTF